ncbi:MAG: malto-oligosyltrehalose trehalohydrolase [Thermoanaerobaculia bacterium]
MPHDADHQKPIGAIVLDDERVLFRVWAPNHERVELHIVSPRDQRIPLTRTPDGYHETIVDQCARGTRDFYVVGDRERPDPASRLQPQRVHGPSEVVPREFEWHDQRWRGIPIEDYVIYELHIGTFTEGGTFEAAIERLDDLRKLGVTVIELLPVGQFPGERNWGYDGVFVNAAQSSYGGPLGLKRLADACHARGLAIALDVVYNHLGPEGNYLSEFAPYFTDRYKTPWGPALNFDGPQSDYVRWFFIHNALQWVDEFHIDALRVDAVHAIIDPTAEPFLQDLTTAVRERAKKLGRAIFTFAETDLNDPRVITPAGQLGLGFDSQWNDDFHHSLHTLLTGEKDGYYIGYGRVADLARVFENGYLYAGQHSPYRGRKYGAKPATMDGSKFVVCAQNHDQIGNRMLGDRLSALVPPEALKLVAAAVVLSPFLPMLFMGEEYGEKAPFQYFTSHADPDLIEAVRKGRREEFDDFEWHGEPPDPHDEETFRRSKLDWSLPAKDEHAALWRLYQELFRLRRETPTLRTLDLTVVKTHVDEERRTLLVQRDDVLIAFNFSDTTQTCELPAGRWHAAIETGGRVEGGVVVVGAWGVGVLKRA